MKRILMVLIVGLSLTALGQNTTTWQQTQTKAKETNKNILLVFSGSDWCAPCIKFKKQFLEAPEFVDFAKENLIYHPADFPRLKKNQLPKAKQEDNDRLAEQYNPSGAFPLVLLLTPEGKIIKRWDKLPNTTVTEFCLACSPK